MTCRRFVSMLAIAFAACWALPLARACAQQSYYESQRLTAPAAVEARPISTNAHDTKPAPAIFPFRQVAAAEDVAGADPQPLKLAPRKSEKSRTLVPAANATAGPIGTVIGSLAVVLGLFLALVWVSRRFSPAGSAALPKEVVEPLGRTPLGGRQSLQLLRVGNKLVLVAMSTGMAEPITEITDPLEVERLYTLCRRGRPDSASASFGQVLNQLSSERPPPAARPRVRGAT